MKERKLLTILVAVLCFIQGLFLLMCGTSLYHSLYSGHRPTPDVQVVVSIAMIFPVLWALSYLVGGFALMLRKTWGWWLLMIALLINVSRILTSRSQLILIETLVTTITLIVLLSDTPWSWNKADPTLPEKLYTWRRRGSLGILLGLGLLLSIFLLPSYGVFGSCLVYGLVALLYGFWMFAISKGHSGLWVCLVPIGFIIILCLPIRHKAEFTDTNEPGEPTTAELST